MKKINPADLEKHFKPVTMKDAINDIINRFDGEVFTTRHIRTAVDVLPEYKHMRGQGGFYNAVRDTISERVKMGDIARIGNYNGSHFAAYKAVIHGD